MFPGKEDTFDLLYLPRFSRLLAGAIRRELKLAGLDRAITPTGSIASDGACPVSRRSDHRARPVSGVGNDYILPGFIDLQVNGSHGIDVMTAPPTRSPL